MTSTKTSTGTTSPEGRHIHADLGDPVGPLPGIAGAAFRAGSGERHRYVNIFPFHQSYHSSALTAPLVSFLNKRNYRDSDGTPMNEKNIVMSSGGTSFLYDTIVRTVRWQHDAAFDRSQTDCGPAFLFPTPTYGLFLQSPEMERYGMFPVRRSGRRLDRIDPEDLRRSIDKARNCGFAPRIFFDSNPNNPCGFVRDRAAVEEIAAVLDEAENFNRTMLKPGDLESGPYAAYPNGWQLNVIDDMVYDGLVYNRAEPFGFGTLPGYADKTYTLFGLSKVGLPGMRAAFVAAARQNIRDLDGGMQLCGYTASSDSIHALSLYFNRLADPASGVNRHLKRTNALYRANSRLMKALIDGVESLNEPASDREIAKMTDLVVKTVNITPEQAKFRLTKGIPGLKILTAPQSGFFHLLDMSWFRGRAFGTMDGNGNYGSMTIDDSSALLDLTKHFAGMGVLPGVSMGCEDDAMICRLSFAFEPAEIVLICDRLGRMVMKFLNTARPVAQTNRVPHIIP